MATAILLDMDGVLIDSEAPQFENLRGSLRAKGIHVSLGELLERFTGKSSYNIASEIVEDFGLGQSPDEFLADHRARNKNFYQYDDRLEHMAGVLDFLDTLYAADIRMALVSSTTSKSVLFAVNRLNLLHYLDAIVCGDQLSEVKPAPEGYLAAAGYLDVHPQDCIVIEDSALGIQAGKNAGMKVVGFKGSTYMQDTSLADLEVDSFSELLANPAFLKWVGL